MKQLIKRLQKAADEITLVKPDSEYVAAVRTVLKELVMAHTELMDCPTFGPDLHDHPDHKWCIRTTSVNNIATCQVRSLETGTIMAVYEDRVVNAEIIHTFACNQFDGIDRV